MRARVLLAAAGLATLTLGSPSAAPSGAAAPAAGPAASLAGEGSLVFVRDHDVWIAQVDGTLARPLTTDGTVAHPYHSPSQSDTGVVVAARDERIVRMTDQGQVLNLIDPPALTNSIGHAIDGTPSDVAISPDGSLIAYTHAKFECASAADCDTRFVTAFTAADHLSDPATLGTSPYSAPAWFSGTRLVLGGGQIPDVKLQSLGSAPTHWFRDSEIESPGRELTDPAVSRDGRWVATVRGWGTGTSLLWSTIPGDVRSGTQGLPVPRCETNREPLAGPAFSADSTRLAYVLTTGATPGIWQTRTGDSECHDPVPVVPGGSEPGFSAAPYAVGRAPEPAPAAAPSAGTGQVAAPHVVAAPGLKGKARVGRTLRATTGTWTPAATTYAYRWTRNGTAIRGATAATYRLTRRDARARLAVVVTATGPGGSGTATSRVVRVRR